MKKSFLVAIFTIALVGVLTGCGNSDSSSMEETEVVSSQSEDGWVYENESGVYAVHDTNPVVCNGLEFVYKPEKHHYTYAEEYYENVQNTIYKIGVGLFKEDIDLMGDVSKFDSGSDGFEMVNTVTSEIIETTNADGIKVRIFSADGEYVSTGRIMHSIYIVTEKGLILKADIIDDNISFTQEELKEFVVFSEGWTYK